MPESLYYTSTVKILPFELKFVNIRNENFGKNIGHIFQTVLRLDRHFLTNKYKKSGIMIQDATVAPADIR